MRTTPFVLGLVLLMAGCQTAPTPAPVVRPRVEEREKKPVPPKPPALLAETAPAATPAPVRPKLPNPSGETRGGGRPSYATKPVEPETKPWYAFLGDIHFGFETNAGNAGVTAGLSTFANNTLTGRDLIQSATSGMVAGTTTFFVVRSYESSPEQRRYAYVSGERAVQRVAIRRRLETTRARTVAVRVPKSKASSARGTDVMLVNASTGRPQSDQVYVVSGNLDDGSEVDLQGTHAVFSARAAQ